MKLFLKELYQCWPKHKRPRTIDVCKMFNPSRSERRRLRELWMGLGEGGWTIANVERVLKSCVGTTITSAGATYTFVQRRGRARWAVWSFDDLSLGHRAFAGALRRAMAGRQMTLTELHALLGEDEELLMLAASCVNWAEEVGPKRLYTILRELGAVNYDGFTLVQMPSKRWIFVGR